MVALIGPFATRNFELRQAWKGATVEVDLCAEVWLVGVISNLFGYSLSIISVLIVSDFQLISRYHNHLRSSN
jgi:hypothetical protein